MMRLRTIFMSIALCTLATLSAKEYSFITVKGDAMQTRIYTLNNGLKVYMSVNKERPRLQANIVVRTGSRNDPAETTGLAHFLEHLMFKGTQRFGTTDYAKEKPYLDEIERRYEQYRTLTDPVLRRTAYHQIDSISQLAAQYNIPNEYDKLMSSIGSEGTNAYTSNDVTCYVENIPSNEIDNWARIQADRFQNMVIRGFHTELEAVYEEKNISMASDGSKEYAALWKLLTPTHPYGTQTTIGEQEHLKNPSIVNIKNYFHRYYVPNNVAIVLAGDFNPDETIAIIDKYFGQWKPSTNLTRPEFPVQPKITAQRDTTVIGQDAENLMMAWRFKGDNDMQSDTLDIVRRMLYNGQAGLIGCMTTRHSSSKPRPCTVKPCNRSKNCCSSKLTSWHKDNSAINCCLPSWPTRNCAISKDYKTIARVPATWSTRLSTINAGKTWRCRFNDRRSSQNKTSSALLHNISAATTSFASIKSRESTAH